ncbi:MAG TPA: nucleoside 2-deoxyribosyltransferase [Magnetospirillaceae bacterium]|nr:nucleoside 2-deoxyribosyltransferase [Magnetospirillaceae bacterium]
MIIYFSASARNLKSDLETYQVIVNKIHSLDHNLALEWLEPARRRMLRKDDMFEDIESIVRAAQAGVESAELVIVEATGGSTFGVGYEVGLAIQLRKPVLLLIKKEAMDSYATGLKNNLITLRRYDKSNLERTIEDFIKRNVLKTKDLRFNFVLDREIYNHLRLKSFETGRTKAEIVRDLLLNDIKKG